MKFIIALLGAMFALSAAAETKVPYFECVHADNGHTYTIVKVVGQGDMNDIFEYENSDGGPYMPTIAYMNDTRFTRSGLEDTPWKFEVWEKESQTRMGSGLDYILSKFTLDKSSGNAKHVVKRVRIFVTTKKETENFVNCVDVR